MEENNKIIELDEEKIENLDAEVEKERKSYDDEINKLNKKLKKVKRVNIFLSIFSIISLIVFITIVVFFSFLYNNFSSQINMIFKNKANIASISQIGGNNVINIQNFADKLAYIDDIVSMLYYYDKDNNKLEEGMFEGYMNSLGDKYAQYFPKNDFKDFTEKTTEGVYYGIGCIVTQNQETKDCTITSVYEDSPAEKGGLLKDDIIISIDDIYVRGDDVNSLVEKIKGPIGTERKIEVYRKNINQNVICTCFCGKVDIKLVKTEIYDDNIGYIDLDEFTGKATNQFKTAIDELLDKNIKGLIIDCRGNVGGELTTVLNILDYLLKDRDGRYTLNQKEEIFDIGKTLLVYIKDKQDIIDAKYAHDKHSVDIPMVVLTDFSTASAAELFTETLRDYKKAEIVGTRTYGKGVVQNVIPIDDGSAIKFTISEYFPASGYAIDKKGILPDYSLDYNGDEITYDEDNNIIVYEKGIKYILNPDGTIKDEIKIKKASKSEIKKSSSSIIFKSHKENLKIYDDNNNFLNEDWFTELNDKYEDKQLLQALIVMKNKLGVINN